MEIIRCLLRARTDYITVRNVEWSMPTPDPGWTKCVDCRINRRAHGHCSVCNDTGWKRKRGDEVEYDRYLGDAVSASEQIHRDRSNHRDHSEDPVDRSLRHRESRNSGGSLDKLERAFGDLADPLRICLTRIYVDGLVSLPNATEAKAVQELALTIPGRLEPPPWDRAAIRELKIRKIRELASSGYVKTKDVAQAVGCSQSLVRSVLAAKAA